MKKKTFIKAIEAIKAQLEHDHNVSTQLGRVFSDAFEANLYYDNHFLSEGLLNVLQVELGDKGEWIGYFCYELDFGKKYKPGCATNADGTNIDLSTAGKLYDFLKK